MADEKELRRWVSSRLHDLLGFSESTVAQFVLSVARKHTSADSLGAVLKQQGLPSGKCLHAHARTCMHHIHTYIHTHTRMHAHARTHTHTHTHTHTYTHAHTHTHTHTYANTNIRAHTLTYYTQLYTQAHAYKCKQMHMGMHACT